MTSNLVLLLLVTLTVLTQGIKVQCESEKSSWDPNKKFRISERELLVDTIYGVSLVIDDWDGTVSAIIKNSGTW